MPKYKRILLKMSGEALKGNTGYGIDPTTVKEIAKQINTSLEQFEKDALAKLMSASLE